MFVIYSFDIKHTTTMILTYFPGDLRKNECALSYKYKISIKNSLFRWEEFNLDLTLTGLSIINATLYIRKLFCWIVSEGP